MDDAKMDSSGIDLEDPDTMVTPDSERKEVALLDMFKSGIEQSLALVHQMSESERAAALSTLATLCDQVSLSPPLPNRENPENASTNDVSEVSVDTEQRLQTQSTEHQPQQRISQMETRTGSTKTRGSLNRADKDHASYAKKRKTRSMKDKDSVGDEEKKPELSLHLALRNKKRNSKMTSKVGKESLQSTPNGKTNNALTETDQVDATEDGGQGQGEKKLLESSSPARYKCKNCTKSFATKFGLSVHIRSHTGEKPYECDICNKAFSCSNNRQRHIRETHQGVRPFPCTQCPAGFYKEKKLKQHLMVDHGMAEEEAHEERHRQVMSKKASHQSTFPCPNCEKIFKTRSNLRVHEAVHAEKREHACPHCQKTFSFRTNLKRHLMIHTGERPHKCNLCDKGFIENKSLQLHMSKEHGEYKAPDSFQCEECGKQLASRASLLNHHLTHTGSKPHTCAVCDKRFSMKANLKRHVRLHSGDKPWECPKCHKCFTEKKSMEVHYRIHTGEKPYGCEICGKRFAQAGTLQAHKPVHERRRSLCCELCGKSFLRKSHYRFHMQKHTNPPKFHCEACPLAFYRKADLQRHNLTHTGERPYQCKLCPKQFSRPAYLKDHMNRHLGCKPYSCDYCAVAFAESSARVKHMKRCPMMHLVSDSVTPTNTLLASHEEVTNIVTVSEPQAQALNPVQYPVSLLKLNQLTTDGIKTDAIGHIQSDPNLEQVETAADNLLGLANGGVTEVVSDGHTLQTVNEAEASLLLGHSISNATNLSTIDVTTVKEVRVQAVGTEEGTTSHFIFLLQDPGTVDTA